MAEESAPISINTMVENKPLQFAQLVFIQILDTKRAMDEGGEKAERAVMTFRPLLAIYADEEYLESWRDRELRIRKVKEKYERSSTRDGLDHELYPLLLEEYEALLKVARRLNLFGTGGARRERI